MIAQSKFVICVRNLLLLTVSTTREIKTRFRHTRHTNPGVCFTIHSRGHGGVNPTDQSFRDIIPIIRGKKTVHAMAAMSACTNPFDEDFDVVSKSNDDKSENDDAHLIDILKAMDIDADYNCFTMSSVPGVVREEEARDDKDELFKGAERRALSKGENPAPSQRVTSSRGVGTTIARNSAAMKERGVRLNALSSKATGLESASVSYRDMMKELNKKSRKSKKQSLFGF